MGFFGSIVARRIAVLAISAASGLVVPYIVQDKPVLKWTWTNFGPIFIDAAKAKVDPKPETNRVQVNVNPVRQYDFIPKKYNDGIRVRREAVVSTQDEMRVRNDNWRPFFRR